MKGKGKEIRRNINCVLAYVQQICLENLIYKYDYIKRGTLVQEISYHGEMHYYILR